MDPITHGLLGAAVSQAATRPALPKQAIWIGSAAAMIPDLDILIRSSQNPTLLLIYHRHFTHALMFVPLGGLIVCSLFMLFFKHLRPKWFYVLLAATVAYLTHGLLDAATSYGTLLWWPWSMQRVAWDLIAIVDPVFTLILLVGVILCYRQQKRTAIFVALLASFMYLGFGAWQHTRALKVQKELATTRGEVIEKGRAMPKLGHLFGYSSIYISGRNIYLDDIKTPLLKTAFATNHNQVTLFTPNDLPASIKNDPVLSHDFDIFNWFSDGYVAAISQQPLTVVDMRYTKRLSPLKTLWGIEFPNQLTRTHVYWKNTF